MKIVIAEKQYRGITRLEALTVNKLSCKNYSNTVDYTEKYKTRIWANAQRDGPPAEHRWRPLFNAANFG